MSDKPTVNTLDAQQPAFERPSVLKQCAVRYAADSGPARSAQQPGVVLPERLRNVLAFLDGSGELDGFVFGEKWEKSGQFWWRKELREALAELNSSPVSSVYQCPRCSTSMQVDPDAKPASAGAVDERAGVALTAVEGVCNVPGHSFTVYRLPESSPAQLAAPAGSFPAGWTVDRAYSPNGYVLHSPCGSMIRVCDAGGGGIETAFALFLKELLAAAPSPAPSPDVVPVPRELLANILRDGSADREVHAAYLKARKELRALLNGGRDE